MISEVAGIPPNTIATRLLLCVLIQAFTMLTHLHMTMDVTPRVRALGGGGTEFDVVWKYMEQEGIEPDQLIMFTDGYPWNSWGDPNYCDTLFVIHGDPQQRIQAPFGTTIHYEAA